MKNILISGLALIAAACTSFQGRPSPIVGMKAMENMVTDYPQDQAVDIFYASDAARGGLTQKQYRNKILSVYMGGINARYENFVIALSTQNKISNLGLETLALALSSGATLAGETTANALSAGSAFALGSNSKINQKLYYERTLPALVTAMNAARLDAEAKIVRKMTLSAAEYPIEAAFSDLARYQSAASIDGAIGIITAQVADVESDAKDNLDEAETEAFESSLKDDEEVGAEADEVVAEGG